MYARTTTVQGRPEAVDDGIAMVRDEVMPALEEMGSVGVSMLVDRTTGRCIVTTAWDSERALRDSADKVGRLRERATEVLQSGPPDVRHYEIGVLHRMRRVGEGACARVIWMDVDPGRIDEHLELVRTIVVPRAETFPGFCSLSMLVDRESGRCAASSTFVDRASLDASREPATRLREEMESRGVARMREVAEFDVALAHLRVPETV